MRIATANVLVRLGPDEASVALTKTLARRPTILGLQEWGRGRKGLLREVGRIFRLPTLRRKVGRSHPAAGWVFGYPLTGGQPVGVDAAQAELLSVRRVFLAAARRGVRPTWGTEALIRLRATGELVVVLNTHLIAHHDRPANKAAWEEGVASINRWHASWPGHRCYVVGDMNRQRLQLEGLVSCWVGNKRESTFRHRVIDEVYGPAQADHADAIDTPSDHDSVIATYSE